MSCVWQSHGEICCTFRRLSVKLIFPSRVVLTRRVRAITHARTSKILSSTKAEKESMGTFGSSNMLSNNTCASLSDDNTHLEQALCSDQSKSNHVNRWRNWALIPNWCSLCCEPHNGWFVHTGKRDHNCFEIIFGSIVQYERRWCARDLWSDLHHWLDRDKSRYSTKSSPLRQPIGEEAVQDECSTPTAIPASRAESKSLHSFHVCTHVPAKGVCHERAHTGYRVDHRPYMGDLGPSCQSPLLLFQAAYAAHDPVQRRCELIACLHHLQQHGQLHIHRNNVQSLSLNGFALLQKEFVPRMTHLFPSAEARYHSSMMAKLGGLGNMDLVYDVCGLGIFMPAEIATMYTPCAAEPHGIKHTQQCKNARGREDLLHEVLQEEEETEGTADEMKDVETAGSCVLPSAAKSLLCSALLGILRWSADSISAIAPPPSITSHAEVKLVSPDTMCYTNTASPSSLPCLSKSSKQDVSRDVQNSDVMAVIASCATNMLISEIVACFLMEQVSRVEGQMHSDVAQEEMTVLLHTRFPLLRRSGRRGRTTHATTAELSLRNLAGQSASDAASTSTSGSFLRAVRGQHSVSASLVPKMPNSGVAKSVVGEEGPAGRALYRNVSTQRLYLRKMRGLRG